MGRRTKAGRPGSRGINYQYAATGELVKTYGSDTHPVEYAYDGWNTPTTARAAWQP